MDPLTLSLIMAGAGAAKSELIDKKQAEADRKLAAATQRLSPWTGLKADRVKEADPFGTALQFGATGAMMGESMATADAKKAYTNRVNSGGDPDGYGMKMAEFSAPKSYGVSDDTPYSALRRGYYGG